MELIDQHQRKVRKLRLSLTDKCNLRCHYCMPVDQTFMNESRYLTPREYAEIVNELCSLGVEEIRITGGEPLLRKSFSEIANLIGNSKAKKIGLTTNGILIDKYLDVLVANRVFHLNVSLDSLDAKNFKRITNGQYLEKVISNIRLARDAGLIVKINVVAMKGINDHEVLDFVRFAEDEKIEVRFLEVMKIGFARKHQEDQFISAKELMHIITEKFKLRSVNVASDSTSFNYITENGGQIGFIASESQPFCGNCSRWRLSADGILRACLLKEDGRNIKNKCETGRLEVYHEILGMKPYTRPTEVTHQMNVLGG